MNPLSINVPSTPTPATTPFGATVRRSPRLRQVIPAAGRVLSATTQIPPAAGTRPAQTPLTARCIKRQRSMNAGAAAVTPRSEILETNRLNSIFRHVKPTTLICLDLDNTTMEAAQEMGSNQWFEAQIPHYKDLGCSPEEALHLALNDWFSVVFVTKQNAVERRTARIIRELQDKRFHVMGLTTRSTPLDFATKRQLADIHIDLTRAAPTAQKIIFLNPREVMFEHGILFTSATHKGRALFQFLDRIKEEFPTEKIQEVLFINDKESDLKQVQETCKEHGMSFKGLRYGATDYRVKNLQKDVAAVQWERFSNILSNEEARQLLARRK